MSPKKTMRWMFAVALIGLAAEATTIEAASAPEANEEDGSSQDDYTVDDSSASQATAAAAATVSLPSNAPIGSGIRLIGTAVVERGASIAVIQFPNGPRFVWEGEEITTGMRLVKVRRDAIDVERSGTLQAIRSRQGAGPDAGGAAPQAPVAAAVEVPAESRSRMGRSLFYSQQARN
jgi:hypothetical protein